MKELIQIYIEEIFEQINVSGLSMYTIEIIALVFE
jgi:hypothetical protein